MQLFNSSIKHEPKNVEAFLYQIRQYRKDILNDNIHNISIEEYEGLEISEEALKLLKILRKVNDSCGQILHTFKTNIFRGFKKVKRSELRFYYDSNKSKVKSVEKINYDKLMEISVPSPTGMITEYIKPVNATTDYFRNLLLKSTLKNTIKDLTTIYKELSKETIKYDLIDSLVKKLDYSPLKNKLKSKYDIFINCYNNRANNTDRPFTELFKNMAQMKEVRETLLSNESYVLLSPEVEKDSEKIYTLLTNIEELMKLERINVSKSMVLGMVNTVEFLADYVSSYGNMVKNVMVLEHNLINDYNMIYDKVK